MRQMDQIRAQEKKNWLFGSKRKNKKNNNKFNYSF